MTDAHRVEIRQAGDPILRRTAEPVEDVVAAAGGPDAASLRDALLRFRAEHGFGRAIAAPQIGWSARAIALDLGAQPPNRGAGVRLLFNPEITDRSPETFELWDDCMSFPELMVRVRRSVAIDLRYVDEDGAPQHWSIRGRDVAELLQHEIDHLDGVLALDRAQGPAPFMARSVFEAARR